MCWSPVRGAAGAHMCTSRLRTRKSYPAALVVAASIVKPRVWYAAHADVRNILPMAQKRREPARVCHQPSSAVLFGSARLAAAKSCGRITKNTSNTSNSLFPPSCVSASPTKKASGPTQASIRDCLVGCSPEKTAKKSSKASPAFAQSFPRVGNGLSFLDVRIAQAQQVVL